MSYQHTRVIWKFAWLFVYFMAPFCFGQLVPKLGTGLSPDTFGDIKGFKNLSLSVCKGPKRFDCGPNQLEVSEDDSSIYTFTIELKKNTAMERFKLAVWLGQGTLPAPAGSPDFVKAVDHPCSHFFMGGIMTKYLGAASNCISKKGVYKFTLHMKKMFDEFFGSQFFYGSYKTHAVLLSKSCNIICVNAHFSLEKPKP